MQESVEYIEENSPNQFIKDIENQYKTDLGKRLFNFAILMFKYLKSIDSNRL